MSRWIRVGCDLSHPAKFLASLCHSCQPTRDAARRVYQLFATNPDHPSLRFKKLSGHQHVWSVRINQQYRAVGERSGDTIVWFWVGTHNDFDKLFG